MRVDGGNQSLPLDAFRRVEGQDGQVQIVAGKDGQPEVIAQGRTEKGVAVSWVRPGSGSRIENEVTQRFLESVSSEFGSRITRSIARELGIDNKMGDLDTHVVERALQMAATERTVFSGANFFVELHCSAQTSAAGFKSACAELGVDANLLDVDSRQQIDERFRSALTEASGANQEPLSTGEGERILVNVLRQWQQDNPKATGA